MIRHDQVTKEEIILKRIAVILSTLLLVCSGNALALNKNKLKNPTGFIVKERDGTTLYTADIYTDNGIQIIENTGCLVDIVPTLLYSDSKDAAFCVYFHLYSFSVPKPDLKIAINANGSRFTFKPIGQSISVYKVYEQGPLYRLTCSMPIGNKGKKMLKDISLSTGPILVTYEVTLDENNIVLSGNMIDYHRQCFTRVRDLFVDCGAVNDDYSGYDEMTGFKSESSK